MNNWPDKFKFSLEKAKQKIELDDEDIVLNQKAFDHVIVFLSVVAAALPDNNPASDSFPLIYPYDNDSIDLMWFKDGRCSLLVNIPESGEGSFAFSTLNDGYGKGTFTPHIPSQPLLDFIERICP